MIEPFKLRALRAEIESALATVASATALDAADFHAARYRLYALAAADWPQPTVEAIRADADLAALAARAFAVAAQAGVVEECAIARQLVEDKADFDALFRAYHGEVYEGLRLAEVPLLDAALPGWMGRPLAYVGGGALPVPAMLMARRGARLRLVDRDAESNALAAAVAEQAGVADRLEFHSCDGCAANFLGVAVAWLANWTFDKAGIMAALRQAGAPHAMVRAAAPGSLSFLINDPVAEDFPGWVVAGETPKQLGLSLVSRLYKRT